MRSLILICSALFLKFSQNFSVVPYSTVFYNQRLRVAYIVSRFLTCKTFWIGYKEYQQKLRPTQIKSRNVVPGRGMPPYSLKWVNALLSLAQGSQPFPTLELPGFFSSS